MKIFKEDESLLEIASKIFTILGIVFGGWAYFHTIHPIFQKEMELQRLSGESQALTEQILEKDADLNSLNQNKVSLETIVASLSAQQAELEREVAEKESQLREIVASFQSASDAAVMNKLQLYSEKITSSYLLAIRSGRSESFDVLGFSKELLISQVADREDEHSRQAYDYFRRYIESHGEVRIDNENVVKFALTPYFDYKIGLLEQSAIF